MVAHWETVELGVTRSVTGWLSASRRVIPSTPGHGRQARATLVPPYEVDGTWIVLSTVAMDREGSLRRLAVFGYGATVTASALILA